LQMSILLNNFGGGGTLVYLKLLLEIRTAFRVSTSSWIFSLVQKLFLKENTRLISAQLQANRKNSINFSTIE
jgi:hypothetical protein